MAILLQLIFNKELFRWRGAPLKNEGTDELTPNSDFFNGLHQFLVVKAELSFYLYLALYQE